jgi:hypothetical protein
MAEPRFRHAGYGAGLFQTHAFLRWYPAAEAVAYSAAIA